MRKLLINFFCFLAAILVTNQTRATDLSGLWKMDCSHGLSKEQDIDNQRSVTTENFYQDRFCKSQTFQFKTTGLLEFPEENKTWIDFTYTNVELTVFHEMLIEDLNARQVCGYNDWQLAKPKTITGLRCALFNMNKETQISKAGDQKFGLFKLEGGRLYFGQLTRETDGSASSKRPATWAQESYQK